MGKEVGRAFGGRYLEPVGLLRLVDRPGSSVLSSETCLRAHGVPHLLLCVIERITANGSIHLHRSVFQLFLVWSSTDQDNNDIDGFGFERSEMIGYIPPPPRKPPSV